MNADRIGMALKGRRKHKGTGWTVRCPVPSHGTGRGDLSPSLSVADGKDGRLLLNCVAGCNFEDILAELQRLGLVDAPRLDRARQAQARVYPAQDHQPDPAAIQIWQAAGHVGGTVAAEYLERRGILNHPPSIRGGTHLHLNRYPLPTLLAAVQRPDGKIVAVQNTFLTPNATKAPVGIQKVTTGALGAGAVRLGPAGEVLGLAEGIETALSAQVMSEVTVWASLGAARMHRVELPECVHEVHIFGDNDNSGRTAAQRTAEVHKALGRQVVLRFPPAEFKDFNDLLLAHADCDGDDARLIASLKVTHTGSAAA